MSITNSLNDNDDDLVSGFDGSTFSGDSVYDIFEDEGKITTEGRIFGSTLIKQFGKG